MRTKNRQSPKRLVALGILLCLVMVSLLSETFILTHANHKHDHFGVGGECAVCAQVQSAENQLKQFGTVISVALLALIGFFAALAILYFAASSIAFQTPVYLKTRLNN